MGFGDKPINLIHGDLAARNVLLDGNLGAKISDFGMSRKLYEYQIYISRHQTIFPWRCMSPEGLDRLEFSLKSDVWMYGVLLWEIFTLGDTPWAGRDWSSDFLTGLRNGDRLEQPVFVKDCLFEELFLPCWKWSPMERPSFGNIRMILRKQDGGDSIIDTSNKGPY